ncbi:hypothetical protein [Marinactinospora rubrisoli]|uniref:Uncharacterized protein n=1 Tax=Marinactinospora rubrisoli TaxID=2715399 RepID=A0ABW2KQ04_9ACTN
MSAGTVTVVEGQELAEPGALAVTAVREPGDRLVVEVRFGAGVVVRLPLGDRESVDVAQRIEAAGQRAVDLLRHPDKAAAVAACRRAADERQADEDPSPPA